MVTTQTQIRRDTATNLNAATPATGELGYDTTNKRLVVGDGSTAGGIRIPNITDTRNQVFNYGTVGGTANAITLTNSPAVAAYVAGLKLVFKATATNSGAATLNVDGLGAKNIYKISGTSLIALSGSEIVSGAIIELTYDGTQFQLTGSNAAGFLSKKTQIITSTGTYIPSAGMLYCDVEIVAGGGGACSNSNNGSAGGNTTFGALLTANGGAGGSSSVAAGGTATGGDINITGQSGLVNTNYAGSSMLGIGAAVNAGGTGNSGTGYGAGGGANLSTGTKGHGAGGGYCKKTFTAATIGASQSVTIGAGGLGGSGTGGGNGTAGVCIIEEYCSIV